MFVNNKKAFTLVEIMIVVAIIGFLTTGIAVHNYVKTRETAQTNICRTNRSLVERGEQLYVLGEGRHSDSIPALVEGKYLKSYPACPAGGTYAWMPGTQGTPEYQSVIGCSVHGIVGGSGGQEAIDGLIAGWSMDEGKGNTIGEGEVAGQIYGATWGEDPERGTGLVFDGINDYVKVPGDGLLKMPFDQITYGLWFKSGENFTDGISPQRQDLISKNSNFVMTLGQSGDAFKPDAAMYLNGTYVSASGSYVNGKGYKDLVINDDQWHYLTATYDGSTMKLYKDGQVILEKTGLTGVVGKAGGSNSSLPVYLGAQNGSSNFIKGNMDDVAIYDRALSAEEILSLSQKK